MEARLLMLQQLHKSNLKLLSPLKLLTFLAGTLRIQVCFFKKPLFEQKV